ncbi:unnamed protein product [Prorocentrum cordatum]|uniref:Uncharacterized protein n=1 Tax=Prorocentrum cordatum TaxID=2364126 RepID=A0ABN9QSP7_9DINO|nr:unnamed protein product [Polarella glacialis]
MGLLAIDSNVPNRGNMLERQTAAADAATACSRSVQGPRRSVSPRGELACDPTPAVHRCTSGLEVRHDDPQMPPSRWTSGCTPTQAPRRSRVRAISSTTSRQHLGHGPNATARFIYYAVGVHRLKGLIAQQNIQEDVGRIPAGVTDRFSDS